MSNLTAACNAMSALCLMGILHQMQWMRRCMPLQLLETGSYQQAESGLWGRKSAQGCGQLLWRDSAIMDDEELAVMGTAMLKDEDLCIRCGLCAEKCPTQAVTMDAMNYSFRWIG